jgi:hypothetical protein
MDALGYESRDSIKDIWGARTPFKHEWPTRCDMHIVETPDKWIQSACVLCRYDYMLCQTIAKRFASHNVNS